MLSAPSRSACTVKDATSWWGFASNVLALVCQLVSALTPSGGVSNTHPSVMRHSSSWPAIRTEDKTQGVSSRA